MKLSSLFGDGEGNYSMMRVVMFLVVLALIVAKFYNAHITGAPVEFSTQDLAILGTVIGGKLVQNKQEATGVAANVSPASAPAAVPSIKPPIQ
jgi:hypothetical protein